MSPRETSSETEAAQEALWARMSPVERVSLALAMSEESRELTRARLRREHPAWTDREVGVEIFRLAFLPDPLPPWVT